MGVTQRCQRSPLICWCTPDNDTGGAVDGEVENNDDNIDPVPRYPGSRSRSLRGSGGACGPGIKQ